MVAADMIELEEVVQLCTSYLITELEPSNALGIFRFAAAHNCTALAGAALAFIHEHFVDVCKGDEFRDVPRDLLVELLASENLRVDFEYQVS
jgi:actin-binding protein IPP